MIDIYRDDNGRPVLLGCCELDPTPGRGQQQRIVVRGEIFEIVWVGDFDLYDRGVMPAIKLTDDQNPALLYGWQPA